MIYLRITSHICESRRTRCHTSYHLDQELYNELIEYYDCMSITDKDKNVIHFCSNQFWEEPRYVAFSNEEAAMYWKLKL